jgi:transposase
MIWRDSVEVVESEPQRCPRCGTGRLRRLQLLAPQHRAWYFTCDGCGGVFVADQSDADASDADPGDSSR